MNTEPNQSIVLTCSLLRTRYGKTQLCTLDMQKTLYFLLDKFNQSVG